MQVWGLLSSKCYTFFLIHKTKNACHIWGWSLRPRVEGPSEDGILSQFPSGHCSFGLSNQRGGIPKEHFLVASPQPLPIMSPTSQTGFQRDTTSRQRQSFDQNLRVLRSTENMFYWEVSNSSRRTLLDSPGSTPEMLLTLPPGACVCTTHPVRNSFLPTSRQCGELLLEDPAFLGPVNVSHSVGHVLKVGETKNLDFFPVHSFNKYLLISYCVHITFHQAVKGVRLGDECWGAESLWGVLWARARRESGHTGI